MLDELNTDHNPIIPRRFISSLTLTRVPRAFTRKTKRVRDTQGFLPFFNEIPADWEALNGAAAPNSYRRHRSGSIPLWPCLVRVVQ